MDYYNSPRWTAEIADCSMPMTMDTYSNCSYKCIYCFGQFQRAIGESKEDYLANKVKWVNPNKFKRIWDEPDKTQFGAYVKARKTMQWGGLSDQFDDNEDFERSVRAYLYDGSVARFDFMSYKTKCYTEQGGMQVERTEERVEWSGKKMLEMFPNQCEVNSSRKKHFEVKLVEKREDFKKISKHRIKFDKRDFSLF